MTCQTAHITECLSGWIETGTRISVRVGGQKVSQQIEVEPCPSCRPGKRAVREAGLLVGDWPNNHNAMEIYRAVEGKS